MLVLARVDIDQINYNTGGYWNMVGPESPAYLVCVTWPSFYKRKEEKEEEEKGLG